MSKTFHQNLPTNYSQNSSHFHPYHVVASLRGGPPACQGSEEEEDFTNIKPKPSLLAKSPADEREREKESVIVKKQEVP